ncbi:hypothetical protein [Streptomyces spiralis]|uniref:hypothetical protein n=1 Tax=Streptomyces spiralis TaxID=66376 RepID=UPI00368AB5FE
MTTVHATDGARRYHATAACQALRNSQDLSDWDCWDDYCRHQHPMPRAIRELTIAEAIAAGKTPCRACYPQPVPMPPAEDFGHRPVIGFVDGRALNRVCARCAVIKHAPGIWWHTSVRWPCTSAIVLGLVDRPPVGQ